MKKLSLVLLSLVVLLVCLAFTPLLAAQPGAKSVAVGVVKACRAKPSEDSRLLWSPLWVRNMSQVPTVLLCSVDVDNGPAGTVAFGALLNAPGKTVPVDVSCTGEINTRGQGVRRITRIARIDPGKHTWFGWHANELDFRTLVGGQGGFSCTLPPGVALQWVWTEGQSN